MRKNDVEWEGEVCTMCGGHRKDPADASKDCPHCKGTGVEPD